MAPCGLALPPVTEQMGDSDSATCCPGLVPDGGGATWAQLAYNAGARVNRWEFRWDRIEPSRGWWDFQFG